MSTASRRTVCVGAVTLRSLGLVAGTLALACDEFSSRYVTPSDSAGVEIVTNSRPDRTLGWRFFERLRIGGAEQQGGFPGLASSHVGSDSLGRILVLDRRRAAILVFDSSGVQHRSIGGRGAATGALETPVAMTVRPDGSVTVFDAGRAQVVQFGADGSVLQEWALLPREWEPRVVFTPDGMVGIQRAARDSGERVRRLMLVKHQDTTRLGDVPAQVRRFTLPACEAVLRTAPLFALPLAWDARDDLVAASTESDYVITWYVQGRPWKSIRRVVPARAVTETVARDAAAGRTGLITPAGACGADAAALLRNWEFAAEIPAVHGLTLGPDGTMWVRRGSVRGEQSKVDVFSRRGAYIGTLAHGSPTPAGFTAGGDLLAVESAQVGDLDQVVVYGVRRRR